MSVEAARFKREVLDSPVHMLDAVQPYLGALSITASPATNPYLFAEQVAVKNPRFSDGRGNTLPEKLTRQEGTAAPIMYTDEEAAHIMDACRALGMLVPAYLAGPQIRNVNMIAVTGGKHRTEKERAEQAVQDRIDWAPQADLEVFGSVRPLDEAEVAAIRTIPGFEHITAGNEGVSADAIRRKLGIEDLSRTFRPRTKSANNTEALRELVFAHPEVERSAVYTSALYFPSVTAQAGRVAHEMGQPELFEVVGVGASEQVLQGRNANTYGQELMQTLQHTADWLLETKRRRRG